MVIVSLLLLAAAPVVGEPVRPWAGTPVIRTVKKSKAKPRRRGRHAIIPVGIPKRLSVNECADRTRPDCRVQKRSPYRLQAEAAIGPASKDRAVAMDGSDCEVIGQKVCPSNPRPVLRAEYAPVGAK
ncbi:hypothetical protein G4G27_13450 [Sphingomonas sp. So64.6b]|uniref:hypothetical protein n=1 Tax=Sphingomonas sp. So64.6b TaxID=2997354 RepID=UPI0015FF8368|nr:hypothetical protein [Sphingomonas sp. So64.6b]QNA84890.1 hypothetical protein G4G27_13450 [Sphingomonas sp. So64.6b]